MLVCSSSRLSVRTSMRTLRPSECVCSRKASSRTCWLAFKTAQMRHWCRHHCLESGLAALLPFQTPVCLQILSVSPPFSDAAHCDPRQCASRGTSRDCSGAIGADFASRGDGTRLRALWLISWPGPVRSLCCPSFLPCRSPSAAVAVFLCPRGGTLLESAVFLLPSSGHTCAVGAPTPHGRALATLSDAPIPRRGSGWSHLFDWAARFALLPPSPSGYLSSPVLAKVAAPPALPPLSPSCASTPWALQAPSFCWRWPSLLLLPRWRSRRR